MSFLGFDKACLKILEGRRLPNNMVHSFEGAIFKRAVQAHCPKASGGFKNNFVPLDGGDLLVETGYAPPAEKSPGGFRGLKDGALDFLLGYETAHLASSDEFVVEAVVHRDVVVLEVDGLKPRISPFDSLAIPKSCQEKFLRHPVEAIPASMDVTLKIIEDFAQVSMIQRFPSASVRSAAVPPRDRGAGYRWRIFCGRRAIR